MNNNRFSRFFQEESRLARILSNIVFLFPVATGAGMIAALTFMSDDPAPAIIFALVSLILSVFVGIYLEQVSSGEFAARLEMMEDARSAHHQIEELFAMTDMLQAAEDHDDAGAILTATAHRLLPGNCWALKRGKPHINDPSSQTLCCLHQIGTAATVEVPMMARGQVHGLLILAVEGADAYDRLIGIRRLARALSDSMSLALSNIALREKLRTQSLRDPLTGLYNRRYMEDALERYISLAERSGSATAVVMIDLDNFKNLNDTYGHAKGDAVLRDVAGQLVSAVRPSDVVCRYGGEELLVILPACSASAAEIKAETLRARIESLSESHGVKVSASFGIATVPETSTGATDIIPMADAALYVAKQDGKNCVRVADKRASSKEEAKPLQAVV